MCPFVLSFAPDLEDGRTFISYGITLSTSSWREQARCTSVAFFQHVIERRAVRLSVENNGFEPLTPCLQSRCSSQLS